MNTQSRHTPTTFTRSAKVGVTLLSLATLVGGWNVIGHREIASADTQPAKPNLAVLATTPSSWPTIVPVPTFEPIPTLPPLNPIFTANAGDAGSVQQRDATASLNNAFTLPALPALDPLPTLAPLPAMPAMPAPPPSPPSSSSSNSDGGGGGNSSQNGGKKSGGS
jgi:hypothetical protein